MLLSVIVPIYNVEAYLEECLAPLCELDSQDCEVLLVDDCGQDGSLAIAKAFEDSMENFRLIRREKNGGLSAARNTGLDAAQGEYVYFLDSDDIPNVQALMQVTRVAQFQKLDVAKARFVYYNDETGERTPGAPVEKTGVMAGWALFAQECKKGVYEPMVWQCVYRRAYLEEKRLRMNEGCLYEDEMFSAPAIIGAMNVRVFEETILSYRQREGSIMKSFARSGDWCVHYMRVCMTLGSFARSVIHPQAKAALKKRVGQIALSIVKNVAGYRLEGEVADAVMQYAREYKKEISDFAIGSGDPVVLAQGWLLRLSPDLFLKLYRRA